MVEIGRVAEAEGGAFAVLADDDRAFGEGRVFGGELGGFAGGTGAGGCEADGGDEGEPRMKISHEGSRA